MTFSEETAVIVSPSTSRDVALTTSTKNSTLCFLYGRMLLTLLTSALGSPLLATVWQQHQRELGLLKLVRHFQAGAAQMTASPSNI